MKIEDLKVGMVLKKDDQYFLKITHILDKRILYLIYDINGNGLQNGYIWNYVNDKSTEVFYDYIPVEKLPPNIIESYDEEVPLYISANQFQTLSDENRSGFDPWVSLYKENFYDPHILCTIKKRVSKKLEFNWDKGIYE